MPRYRRLVVPGYPHHITQRGVRKQQTFFEARDYQAYLDIALELLDRSPLEIWAYCLMPNHIHAVVVPRQEKALSSYFAVLHRRYARRTNARHDWSGHLWQERFYSVVLDERHTLTAMRYVEMNPVRAGLVSSPIDWPWASTRGNLGLSEDPLLSRASTLDLVPDWREYLSQVINDDDLEAIRKQTRIGRPEGTRSFVRYIEEKTGRRVRKRRGGRTKQKW